MSFIRATNKTAFMQGKVMTQPKEPPICFDCARNFKPGDWACDAFAIIPMGIINNQFDHRKPHKDDKGFQFRPKLER